MAGTSNIIQTSDIWSRQSRPNDDFIFPVPTGDDGPNNTVFTIGSTVELKWATSLRNFDLMMYQQLDRTVEACPEVETNPGCVRDEYYIASGSLLDFSIQLEDLELTK